MESFDFIYFLGKKYENQKEILGYFFITFFIVLNKKVGGKLYE